MALRILHGPFDGLLKAQYDDHRAQLRIRYAEHCCVLDEDECDNLLRVVEYAPDTDQAVNDLAEFFQGDFGPLSGRVALWFEVNSCQIAKQVYADTV